MGYYLTTKSVTYLNGAYFVLRYHPKNVSREFRQLYCCRPIKSLNESGSFHWHSKDCPSNLHQENYPQGKLVLLLSTLVDTTQSGSHPVLDILCQDFIISRIFWSEMQYFIGYLRTLNNAANWTDKCLHYLSTIFSPWMYATTLLTTSEISSIVSCRIT